MLSWCRHSYEYSQLYSRKQCAGKLTKLAHTSVTQMNEHLRVVNVPFAFSKGQQALKKTFGQWSAVDNSKLYQMAPFLSLESENALEKLALNTH